jgi:hypothetical protein
METFSWETVLFWIIFNELSEAEVSFEEVVDISCWDLSNILNKNFFFLWN